MKRNKDYLFFILSELQDNYEKSLSFSSVFQKWLDFEPRSENECRDFIFAEQLLSTEGYVNSSVVAAGGNRSVTFLNITWKGYDLMEQLKVSN